MFGLITALFTIESNATTNNKLTTKKTKNDNAILNEFLNTSLDSITAQGYPKPFSSYTNVEKNDNGIFSTFYNMAVDYLVDLVTPVVQYVRDYIEGDCSKYHKDHYLKGNNSKYLSDKNYSFEKKYSENFSGNDHSPKNNYFQSFSNNDSSVEEDNYYKQLNELAKSYSDCDVQ
jgi:hypothetical protein